jgi:hypothetical protein
VNAAWNVKQTQTQVLDENVTFYVFIHQRGENKAGKLSFCVLPLKSEFMRLTFEKERGALVESHENRDPLPFSLRFLFAHFFSPLKRF